jgi:tetratricopeptide (TPR) repeat protein
LGRLDDARELARKAVALDPLSPWKHSRLGWISLDDERFEDAAASFQLALDLAPNAGSLHAGLAAARLLQGRKQEALSIAQAESTDGDRYGALAMIHHSLEHPAESDAALKALIDGYASMAQFQIAEIYAYRNEVDKAFEWLERAYAERDPGVTFVLTDRFLHSLHGDPRWQPFLRKMKLVDSHS